MSTELFQKPITLTSIGDFIDREAPYQGAASESSESLLKLVGALVVLPPLFLLSVVTNASFSVGWASAMGLAILLSTGVAFFFTPPKLSSTIKPIATGAGATAFASLSLAIMVGGPRITSFQDSAQSTDFIATGGTFLFAIPSALIVGLIGGLLYFLPPFRGNKVIFAVVVYLVTGVLLFHVLAIVLLPLVAVGSYKLFPRGVTRAILSGYSCCFLTLLFVYWINLQFSLLTISNPSWWLLESGVGTQSAFGPLVVATGVTISAVGCAVVSFKLDHRAAGVAFFGSSLAFIFMSATIADMRPLEASSWGSLIAWIPLLGAVLTLLALMSPKIISTVLSGPSRIVSGSPGSDTIVDNAQHSIGPTSWHTPAQDSYIAPTHPVTEDQSASDFDERVSNTQATGEPVSDDQGRVVLSQDNPVQTSGTQPDSQTQSKSRRPDALQQSLNRSTLHHGQSQSPAQTPRQQSPSLAPPMGNRAAGWYPDPTGRYEFRWWDGHSWTVHAATKGESQIDPI